MVPNRVAAMIITTILDFQAEKESCRNQILFYRRESCDIFALGCQL